MPAVAAISDDVSEVHPFVPWQEAPGKVNAASSATFRLEVIEAACRLFANLSVPERAEARRIKEALDKGAEPEKVQVDAVATALALAWMHAPIKSYSPRVPSRNVIRELFDEFERVFIRE